MATKPFVLAVEFPRAVRGYAPLAVDDFVRQIGGRMEALQAQIEEQTSRADRLQRELEAANRNLAAFIEREAAIANALVAAEQRRVSVDQQIELDRMNAEMECQRLRTETAEKAEALLAEARDLAEETLADARAEAQEARATAKAEADQTIQEAQATAQAIEAETTERCAAMSGEARSQADAILNEARSSADAIVAEARRVADETAAAMTRDLEVRGAQLQALCMAFEETSSRVRRVLEAQLALLPAPGTTLESLALGDVAVTMSPARESVGEAA